MDKALKDIQAICDASKGRSQVFRSGSHGHLSCIRHHYMSSALDASFSVEPGSAEDLSKIMKVIKESDRKVSFAVKSGGHATNPTFSSTTGIQISMSRFTNISHDEANSRLTVGAGCVFDEIYKVIRAKKYNIVGGGGSVGLSGWILGGGYSLKTNQHGLGIDNLVRAQIVLPDGEVKKAAKDINSDLFWAIKGGANNFGIATEFVLKTHPQGTTGNGFVYGGLLTYDKPRIERVKGAIVNFMKKEDPKAAIVAAFRFYRNQGNEEFKLTVLAFYDDEQPKSDTFKEFLAIPHHGELEKSHYTRLDAAETLLYDYIPADTATMILPKLPSPELETGDSLALEKNTFEACSLPNSGPEIAGMGIVNARARWGNVMVSRYTRNLIDVVEEEAKAAKKLMRKHEGKMVVADIWPFLPTMFKKRDDCDSDSAWPHYDKEPNGPLLVYFMWEGMENDELWIGQMKTALRHIHEIAIQEKCTTNNAPVYCNTTLNLKDVTSVEQIYRHNLADLSALRTKYDPTDVMKRTGGFRIPLGPAIANGTYKIANGNNTIGVKSGSPYTVIKSDGTTVDQFRIPFGDGTVYIISSEDGTGSDNRISQDGQGNVVCKRQHGLFDTWRITPESRKENQLEYSIADAEGKHWVFVGAQVKCIAVGKPLPDNALWRFNLNPA